MFKLMKMEKCDQISVKHVNKKLKRRSTTPQFPHLDKCRQVEKIHCSF